MSTVITHLPAGHLRWKRLRDSPLLSGLPFQILMLLLDPHDDGSEADWTQQAVARRLDVTMHAVRTAFARLSACGYYRYEKRPAGNSWVRHYWFVSDEAGEFGDVTGRIARDLDAARTPAPDTGFTHVHSDVVLQQLTDDTETPVLTTEGKTYPLAPTVDSPAAVDDAPAVEVPAADDPLPAARHAKIRRRLRAPELTRSLQPFAAQAIKLAHDLGIPAWMRPETAGYIAVSLHCGETPESLQLELSRNLGTASSVERTIRWRAKQRAARHAPQLVEDIHTQLHARLKARKRAAA